MGRVAIKLAKECVFGSDVMARGKLPQDGLSFLKKTLRCVLLMLTHTHCPLPPTPTFRLQVPHVSGEDFVRKYWKPSLRAIHRACGRGKEKTIRMT